MPAPDNQALTLVEWAKLSESPMARRIVWSLYKNNNLLQDIPLRTIPDLEIRGKRVVGNLPVPAWRKINELPVAFRGAPDDYGESLYLVRNKVQVDRRLLKNPRQLQDPIQFQWDLFTEGFTVDFNHKLINNSHATGDEDAPEGFRARLDDPAKYGIPAAHKVNFGGIDLTPTNLTATTARGFFRLLNTLFYEVGSPGADNVVIYANDLLLVAFAAAVQAAGLTGGFRSDRDQFDRLVEMFRGAKLRDAGRRADQTTRVITTETAAGADDPNGKFTSIYVVRYGEGSLVGWQPEPMNPSEPTLDPIDKVHFNSVLDWGFGLWQQSNRAIARGYNIKVLD